MQNIIGIAPNIVIAKEKSFSISGRLAAGILDAMKAQNMIVPIASNRVEAVGELMMLPLLLINLAFLVLKEIFCLRLTRYIMQGISVICVQPNRVGFAIKYDESIIPTLQPRGNIIFQKLSLLSRLVKNSFIGFICFIPFELLYQIGGFKQRKTTVITENNHVD